MPNHDHLIAVPRRKERFARATGEAHHRYTNFVNARRRWNGHLFQSRFSSVAMDESHLVSAVRCVSLNPVRVKPALRRVADLRTQIRPDPRDEECFARLRALDVR